MLAKLFPSKKRTDAPRRRQVRSMENPSISLSDESHWDMFGASANGVTVNKKTALSNTAHWAAINRRAKTVGSLSCKVFQRTELGSEPDFQHPLYNLLNRQPHPLYSSFIFWQTLITNLDTDGVAYAHIMRSNGTPQRLEIIQKSQVLDLQKTSNGNYFFIVNKTDTLGKIKRTTIALADMIWLRGLTFDGIDALDPTRMHKDTFSAGQASTRYASSFYENGAQIQYAVETPMQMSPTARQNMDNEFARRFSGLKRAFKSLFYVDKGAKLHELSMKPADAALIDVKKQTAREISRIDDVPGHMIGDGERFTFSSTEIMQLDFVQYSLRNTIKQLELELENKLLTRSELNSRSHKIRFNLDSLLRGDTKTRSEKLINEFKWGLITKNEYREKQDYNRDEGGNYYFNPVNMFPSKQGEEPKNPALHDEEE